MPKLMLFKSICRFRYERNDRLEATLLREEHKFFYTDDDEYWIIGTTYNNPNDHSVMVPKRIGIGTTINNGRKTGKSIYYGSLQEAEELMA